MQKIVTNLWFDTEGLEAAEFYTSVFKNSEINKVTYYPEGAPRPAGTVLTVDFTLDGQAFTALNGGPEFKFSEAISLLVNCEDQAEVDYYWEQLTADGGEESVCGWLKDKYGLSWQIVPTRLVELLEQEDKDKAQRVMQAMLQMKKIEVAELERAAESA